jgi:molecular chaperone DnaK (HSP70)
VTAAGYIVGIDLGTSNCAVAYCQLGGAQGRQIIDFPVQQLQRPGELTVQALLPSVLYLPSDNEFSPSATALPWTAQGDTEALLAGEAARFLSGRIAGRAIASAKSWLLHQHVDRQAPILPWSAGDDVKKRSPVDAQAALLRHIASAWNHAFPSHPLASQQVMLTIPASFDESARALTLQAARDAGFALDRLVLVEEPQAAFYDFISRRERTLKAELDDVKLALVVDVGGGTTDFSLVQVGVLPEGVALRRLAVGDHILLGGDNMDATIAKLIEAQLGAAKTLSEAEWAQAQAIGRQAKEALLADEAPKQFRTAFRSAGSRLVAGSVNLTLERDDICRSLEEGFFPFVSLNDALVRRTKIGTSQLTLPYAEDPAITRHLVAFLQRHAPASFEALRQGKAQQTSGQVPRPDALLLNGGVFRAPRLVKRLTEVVSRLWPERPPVPLLKTESLDLAVARGAVYAGLARQKLGYRISGGAARAVYAVVAGRKGDEPQGVCVIPRGLEEGEMVRVRTPTFKLALGLPVQFRLFTTTADVLDKPGDIVRFDSALHAMLPALHTVIAGEKGGQKEVQLECQLSEVGTLALSCVSGSEQFRLEFELRGAAVSESPTVVAAMPLRFSDAVLEIERVFGVKPMPVGPKDVKNLFRTLEKQLGPRQHWTLPVLRQLWTQLLAGASKRRRSAEHERVLFQLMGYCLRPGMGYPLDGWRCEQTFSLFAALVTFHTEVQVWAEFWVLFRRIALGLSKDAQQQIWVYLKPHLVRQLGPVQPASKVKGVMPLALEEMVRCAASLEAIDATEKKALGDLILQRMSQPGTVGGPWAWALGRVGARLMVGSHNEQSVAASVVEPWVQALLEVDCSKHPAAPFALFQMNRLTGDRSKDVSPTTRAAVRRALQQRRPAG